MNKKLMIAFGMAMLMVGGAFAHHHGGWRGGPRHGWGPRPYYHHHCHGGYWGRGGSWFWPGFVSGVVGGAVVSSVVAPRETVIVQQPAPTVVTQPVVVQQPVVQQPAVVQQPVMQQQAVWGEGRYVDQVQANGSTVRIWQPGHYEQR